ncbi:arsenite efflux transporter metallochaperone ArsD [Patescibacteria group bacterium]|nr:arsenite efflux transporter metallochaperone ArsD [Patescibacteria group bacterium]
MNKTFIIYDPPMCCSSGVCGPNPDQSLMDFQNTLEELKKIDIKVERYIITQSPEMFKQNPKVIKLIQEQQIKALPITTLNGDIVKSGSYPTLDEFKKFSNEK